MNYFKITLVGLINFIIRFTIGGFLYMGIKMDPIGFMYGFILTLTALITAFILLKFVMKPQSTKDALIVAGIWAIMALLIDALTAQPIVHVDLGYLFSELQTWTRVIVILLVAPFTVKESN